MFSFKLKEIIVISLNEKNHNEIVKKELKTMRLARIMQHFRTHIENCPKLFAVY